MAFPIKIDVGAIVGSIGDGAKAAVDAVASIKPEEVLKGAADAAGAGVSMVGSMVGDIVGGGQAQEPPSARPLVELLWCLALADGEVSEGERESLRGMAAALDEGYESYAEEAERQVELRVRESEREFGPVVAAKVEAKRVLERLELPDSR